MSRRFWVLRKPYGPLTLQQNVTLPVAVLGQPYSQSIAAYASGGEPALTFTEVFDVGRGGFSISTAGLITGSPAIPALLTDASGNYYVDQSGDVYTT